MGLDRFAVVFIEPRMVGRELPDSITRSYELLRWQTQ